MKRPSPHFVRSFRRSFRQGVLAPEEVARLLKAALDFLPEIAPALGIKVFCGVRNSELFSLTWDAVKASTIRAEKTKTDKARSVSIVDPLRSQSSAMSKRGRATYTARAHGNPNSKVHARAADCGGGVNYSGGAGA